MTICSEVENARDAARSLVDDFVSGISSLEYSTDALVMRGIPGETIPQLAEELQPDIILVGSGDLCLAAFQKWSYRRLTVL